MSGNPNPLVRSGPAGLVSGQGSDGILKWEMLHGQVTAGGLFGFYRIFRLSINWIVLYMDLVDIPIPYILSFRSMDRAIREADTMEKELIFEHIKKRALKEIDAAAYPGKVKSEDDPTEDQDR